MQNSKFVKHNTQINSPQELMRSRYEAFVRRDWEYIAQTSTNQKLEDLELSPPITWLKLDVLSAFDNIVEFKAYYKLDDKMEVLHETSSFMKIEGVWKYADGILHPSKIERNEPCPCGSGKKFKKCCA